VVRRVAKQTACLKYSDIVPAALGDEAPLWGAVALANDLVLTKADNGELLHL